MADPLYIAAVAGGTAVGAPTRFLVDRFIQARNDRVFPWGTFTVNIGGSLILGLLTGLSLHFGLGPAWLLVLGTGFCGGLTTFSTFGYENLALCEDGEFGAAFFYTVTSIVAGLAAAALGLGLVAWIGA